MHCVCPVDSISLICPMALKSTIKAMPCEHKHMTYLTHTNTGHRECWMIHRGLGCLGIVWFDPYPSLSRQQILSLSQSSCVSPVDCRAYWRETGWRRSRIIRPRESLVLYKSFKTLCSDTNTPPPPPLQKEYRANITGQSSWRQIISTWLCAFQLLEAGVRDVGMGVYYVFFYVSH